MKRTIYPVIDFEELRNDPRLANAAKMDWVRLGMFHRGELPEPLPPLIPMTYGNTLQVYAFTDKVTEAPYVVIDTEYVVATRDLLMIGFYAPGLGCLQWDIKDDDAYSMGYLYRVTAHIWKKCKIVFQNAFADIPTVKKNLGLGYHDLRADVLEDTLLADGVLWSEGPHSLRFMASMYSRYDKMKHLAGVNDKLYNMGDTVDTGAVFEAQQLQFRRDRQSREVYEKYMMPLIPIILDSQARGIAVDRDRLSGLQQQLRRWQGVAKSIAEAYTGVPFNLVSSQQIVKQLTAEGHKVRSIAADKIAALRGRFLAVDTEREVNEDTTLERLGHGGHPLIEARVLHAEAASLIKYVDQMLMSPDGRVYPQFHPWAQANGRWSTVEPPIAQFPGSMRDFLVPDHGWDWFGWDWSQIELRIIAALANDEPLLDAFANNWELHTIHACQFLGMPLPPNLVNPFKDPACAQWREETGFTDKEHPARRMAKILIYRLCYGGDPRNAANIPGAKQLGLDGKGLQEASERWKRAHPAIDRYWKRLIASSLKIGEVRSALGRRRRLMSDKVDERTRQIYDYPMQATVSDIMNWSVIEGVRRGEGHVRLVYTMHDFVGFAVRTEMWEPMTSMLREVALNEWDIGGTRIVFPADFKEKRCSPRS